MVNQNKVKIIFYVMKTSITNLTETECTYKTCRFYHCAMLNCSVMADSLGAHGL